jgi:hypothetical protein
MPITKKRHQFLAILLTIISYPVITLVFIVKQISAMFDIICMIMPPLTYNMFLNHIKGTKNEINRD